MHATILRLYFGAAFRCIGIILLSSFLVFIAIFNVLSLILANKIFIFILSNFSFNFNLFLLPKWCWKPPGLPLLLLNYYWSRWYATPLNNNTIKDQYNLITLFAKYRIKIYNRDYNKTCSKITAKLNIITILNYYSGVSKNILIS